MKKILLILAFINICIANAQEISNSSVTFKTDTSINKQIQFLPVSFTDVTVLILNFETKKDLSLLIKNSKGEDVYSRKIESAKNTSIKLEFIDFSIGEYKTILLENNQVIFEGSIFKI